MSAEKTDACSKFHYVPAIEDADLPPCATESCFNCGIPYAEHTPIAQQSSPNKG